MLVHAIVGSTSFAELMAIFQCHWCAVRNNVKQSRCRALWTMSGATCVTFMSLAGSTVAYPYSISPFTRYQCCNIGLRAPCAIFHASETSGRRAELIGLWPRGFRCRWTDRGGVLLPTLGISWSQVRRYSAHFQQVILCYLVVQFVGVLSQRWSKHVLGLFCLVFVFFQNTQKSTVLDDPTSAVCLPSDELEWHTNCPNIIASMQPMESQEYISSHSKKYAHSKILLRLEFSPTSININISFPSFRPYNRSRCLWDIWGLVPFHTKKHPRWKHGIHRIPLRQRTEGQPFWPLS